MVSSNYAEKSGDQPRGERMAGAEAGRVAEDRLLREVHYSVKKYNFGRKTAAIIRLY